MLKLQSNVILGFIENGLTEEEILVITIRCVKYANKLIKEVKLAYYTNLDLKLSGPNTGQKHFWTTYIKLINKKVNTNIPPIIDNGV